MGFNSGFKRLNPNTLISGNVWVNSFLPTVHLTFTSFLQQSLPVETRPRVTWYSSPTNYALFVLNRATFARVSLLPRLKRRFSSHWLHHTSHCGVKRANGPEIGFYRYIKLWQLLPTKLLNPQHPLPMPPPVAVFVRSVGNWVLVRKLIVG